jgi:hypothetical protein
MEWRVYNNVRDREGCTAACCPIAPHPSAAAWLTGQPRPWPAEGSRPDESRNTTNVINSSRTLRPRPARPRSRPSRDHALCNGRLCGRVVRPGPHPAQRARPDDAQVDLRGRQGRRGQDHHLVQPGGAAGGGPRPRAHHLHRPRAQPQRRLQAKVHPPPHRRPGLRQPVRHGAPAASACAPACRLAAASLPRHPLPLPVS